MQLFTNGVRVDAETLFQQTPDKQRNNDTYQQMVDVAEKSQTFANKGNYTAANQELVKAVNLARYFIANPVDGKTASRKQLVRLNNEYKAAVSGYLKQLSDLQAAIKDAEEPDGVGKTKKIDAAEAEKALKPLFSLFGAGQFDEAVENLAKPAETLAELKDHRTDKEVALSELRLAQKFLESNKVLAHVVENTISPVVLGPLRNSLRGLEGALKAS
jgi:tetratricopeptide (TPR) repeat protein